MNDVIEPPECTASFNGKQILGLFDHTENPTVPITAAKTAGVNFRDAMALGAEAYGLCSTPQGACQGLRLAWFAEQMEGQPKSRLLTDPGQFLQLTQKTGKRTRKLYHKNPLR
jgi:hypothetical protein